MELLRIIGIIVGSVVIIWGGMQLLHPATNPFGLIAIIFVEICWLAICGGTNDGEDIA